MLDELRLAARLGLLLVADRGLTQPCERSGMVLRFDPGASEEALRASALKCLLEFMDTEKYE